MECSVPSCPHRKPGDVGCPIEVSAGTTRNPVKRDQSLVVASLEIGRVLADHGRVTFRAQGTCMFPCVQPGDLLTIESRSIEQVKVGDIVVFRRNCRLLGHRAISKGTRDGRTYVETRPDRSSQGSDGLSYAEDILGVFRSIKRHDKIVSLNPQPLRGLASIHAAGYEWWTWNACPLLIKGIGRLQRCAWYQHAATVWLNRMQRQRSFLVRVPLSAHQLHDLYRQIPSDQFKPEQPLWQGKPALRWILNLHFPHEKPIAGTATVAWHPDSCPRGDGWRIENPQVRVKYRGAGVEDALFRKAATILERSGMTLQRIPE